MSVTDEIKDRLDIVDVISAYVPLKKAGRNYKGLCPFHNEKTPSFIVFPESQNWHCFGACGIGGDIFSFVMKRENLDFGEALAMLAAKAGVELQPREAASGDDTQLERLRAIVGEAAAYFHYLLNQANEAAIARDYLERRGLTRDTWEAWQLGYSLESWDALRDRLLGKGYKLEAIEEAGLVIRHEEGRCYDRFRGRLMIPIRDVQGRTIGFGARVLREDPSRPGPKYINSPQTPLFDKGNVLFGLDMARKAIRDADLAVLVEGYMDVLGSHQVGVSNVVAGMGTALGESQMRQLKRFTNNITLALDPDVAGDHATLRGLESARQSLERDWEPVLSPTGLVRRESRLKAQIRIAALPDGLDPDELALRDVERWRQVIAQAQPVVDYYLAIVSREEDLGTAHGKAAAVERMAPLIAEIANPVERAHYVQALARLIHTDERLVAERVAAVGRQATDGRAKAKEPREVTRIEAPKTTRGRAGSSAVGRSTENLEGYILGWLLLRPDLMVSLDADLIGCQAAPLGSEDFGRAEHQALLTVLQVAAAQTEELGLEDRLADLPEVLRPPARVIFTEAAARPPLTEEKLLKDLGDSVLLLRERNLSGQIEQVKSLIQEVEESSATSEGRSQARQLYELMAIYSAQKRHIHKLLGDRSMAGVLAKQQAERKI